MNELNAGSMIQASTIIILLACPAILVYLGVKNKLTKTRFTRFFGILLIGLFCSLVPMGPLGLLFGFPAVFLCSILVSCFLDRD